MAGRRSISGSLLAAAGCVALVGVIIALLAGGRAGAVVVTPGWDPSGNSAAPNATGEASIYRMKLVITHVSASG